MQMDSVFATWRTEIPSTEGLTFGGTELCSHWGRRWPERFAQATALGGVGESRFALFEVGHDGLDLVRLADQAADDAALFGELFGRLLGEEAIDQGLGAADGIGTAIGDLAGHCQRIEIGRAHV